MHDIRSAGAAALSAVAALLVAAPLHAPLHAQSGSQGARRDPEMAAPEVRRLEIRGERQLDESELRDGIVTEASSCNSLLYRFTVCQITKSPAVYTRRYLDRQELALDVLRLRVLYWRRGYRDAQVDTLVRELSPDDVAVTFDIREGEPTVVDSVLVTGVDSLLRPRRVDRLTVVERGEPLSLLALDSTVLNVRGALWDLGYADAVVDTATVVDTAARRAAVRISATPGRVATVGPIRIEGLERLDPAVVRNSLTIHEGDVYRRQDVFRGQRNLYESGLFRSAFLDTQGEDSVKALTITVREADLQRVRASVGLTTLDYAQVDGRYSHFNFLGGARRLTLQGTLGNLLARQLEDEFIFQQAVDENFAGQATPFLRPTWLLSAELRQPWFQSPENTIAVSVFAHRRATPLVVVDRGQGATATFTREVAPRTNASLTYRFEVTRVQASDVYFCVNFGVCDLATIQSLGGKQRLSPLALVGNVDRSDDPLGATRGYRARLEVEHASAATASNYRYNRGMVEASAYRPFLRGTLAARARIGRTWALESNEALRVAPIFGEDILHPRTRFYAGGSRSVRGYSESQLGPRVLTIAPNRLRALTTEGSDTTYRAGCEPGVPISACPLAGVGLRTQDFTARPLGSPAVAEANVEYRFGVWGPVTAALFLDGAILPAGDDAFFTLDDNFMALTPGLGVRYQSPVGPIRVDIGFNPGGPEALPVFTQEIVDGERRIVQVGADVPPADRPLFRYDPVGEAEGWWRKSLARLVLHLSIGEAF
jgi:outer membrane protein insertion porin family/translocation and assembly module TamA